MGLIQNHVVPLFSSENWMICYCYFIASYADMKAIKFRPTFPFDFALFSLAKISHNFESGTPSFELYLTVH